MLFLAGVLYRRGFSTEYSRCLDEDEAKKVIEESHRGDCGGHVGYQTLTKQIIRGGYYWPTMQKDCHQFVKRCKECQLHAPVIHASASHLHSVTSPWPFSMWAFDIIGPISPAASNGHKYFLAATDYFTKWVEVVTLRTVEGRHVVSFIHKNLLCRFGVPHDIVSDNGTHFKNEKMRQLCSKYHITHHFSAPYYPQGNGQVEATNKILIRILERTVETGRDWHEKMHNALWAYRTTMRTPTNATPAELVYGTEVVLPLHVLKPALKFASLIELPLAQYQQKRLMQLDLLYEKRLKAAEHAEAYRQRVARQFAKSVIERQFKVNDSVLRSAVYMRGRPRGK
uniref:Integrase catalytic domain-containing protein n=2 Tax=Nymphaea colorata TaxID=210225 RepID=A0A5K0XUB1_9MAGN